MKQKAKTLWQVFFEFFKIGLVTFGGGLAMLPVFERVAVEEKKWISQKDLGDIAVVAQSTPGAIAVNCAVFIGCRVAGIFGGIAAMIGAVLPSFLVICGISLVLPQVKDNVYFAAAIRGVGTCVTVLIFNAIFKLAKPMEKILYTFIIVAATFLINLFLQVDIVFLILGGAVLGVLYQMAASRLGLKKLKTQDNCADGQQDSASFEENQVEDGHFVIKSTDLSVKEQTRCDKDIGSPVSPDCLVTEQISNVADSLKTEKKDKENKKRGSGK